MTPDELVKALSPFLGCNLPYEQLRFLGWLDFLQFDRPDTTDSRVMGCAALHYLFCNPGKGCDRLAGAANIVAYVANQTGKPYPAAPAIKALAALLSAEQPMQDDLCKWFQANF